MGNYRDLVAHIGKLKERNKPFLIIKYGVVFNDRANNAYEIVTLGSKRLCYTPIERAKALEAINKYNIPLLYNLGDSRNMIWGDAKFKDNYKRLNLEL